MPDILKVPPMDRHGNTVQIASQFGGPEHLRAVLTQMQAMLYAN